MEILSQILFYIVSSMLIVSAIGAIFAPRIIYSVVCAFVAFISVGFIYFMLNAPFNAAVQIAIYGVAVSILFIFSVMMTGYHKEKNLYVAIAPRTLLAMVGLFFTFVAILIFMAEDSLDNIDCLVTTQRMSSLFDTTLSLAKGLFTNYIFAFELLSIFLLVAVVGLGVILTFKRGEEK